MRKIFSKILIFFFFRPYFAIRTSWPVWFFILNYEGRKLYKKNTSPRDSVEKRIVSDLEKYGIATSSLGELFPEKNWLPELCAFTEKLRPNARARDEKPFLLNLWEYESEISLNNPFIQLSLHPRALCIVNDYMKMFSKFHFFALNEAMPVGENATPLKSQNWHRDPEDKKMCKMFIYLTDVDETSGPFMYVRSSHYEGVIGSKILPQKPPHASYPDSDEMDGFLKCNPDIKVYTAKAGTVIFADPVGLHRGGYATHKKRIMFTAEYSSKAAFRAIHYKLPQDRQSFYQALSPAARFAVDPRTGLLKFWNKISNFAVAQHLY